MKDGSDRPFDPSPPPSAPPTTMTRTTLFLALAATLALPATVEAQRMGGPNRSRISGSGPATIPSAKDIEALNPAAYLLGKKKKLTLDAAQLAALDSVAKVQRERNAPALKQYDHLRDEMRVLARQTQGAPPSETQMAKMQELGTGMRAVLEGLRASRAKDIADALAVVPESEKEKAKALLAELDEEVTELMAPRGGGRPRP